MEKEIQVASFVNDNYYKRREENHKEAEQRKISNLKIYKKTIKYIAVGAVLAIVATNPTVQNKVTHIIDVAIEKDNEALDRDFQQQQQEVRELTGHTIEEIEEKEKTIN